MTINWSLINSGGVFETFMQTLLRFEDPHIILFGRPGPDAGQDALSGDKRRVYQAKFHTSCKYSDLKSDAESELDNIIKYRSPSHKNFKYWEHVTNWTLVTNYKKNHGDKKKWDEEIAPKFAKEGITADLMTIEDMEPLVLKHPDVIGHYFQGKTRLFFALKEAEEFLSSRQVNSTAMDAAFYGRENAVSEIQSRLIKSEFNILALYGPGGVGKSRLGFELLKRMADDGWLVYWAATRSLERSGSDWLSGLPSGNEQDTLIVIDDPDDSKLLEALVEQVSISTSQMNKWKIIITTRTPNDPILATLTKNESNKIAEPLQLQELDHDAGIALTKSLLSEFDLEGKKLDEYAQDLAKRLDYFPIWINLAIRLIREKGGIIDLPQSAHDLADKYLNEIIYKKIDTLSSKDDLISILRWMALYGITNCENQNLLEFIASNTESVRANTLPNIIDRLVERDVVSKRGARDRLHEIKPDVINDHILYTWLMPAGKVDMGAVTQVTEKLIGKTTGNAAPNIEKPLRTLGRLELTAKAKGGTVDLLGCFYTDLKEAIKTGDTKTQLSIVVLLEKSSFARVSDVVEMVDLALSNPKEDEKVKLDIWGERTVTHYDVVLNLAWLLFGSAYYALKTETENLLKCMIRVLKAEMSLPKEVYDKASNDGKRAAALIDRVIVGEPGFWSSFSEDAFKEAMILVLKLNSPQEINEIEAKMLDAIIHPLLKIERSGTKSKGMQLVIYRYTLDPAQKSATFRQSILDSLKSVILNAKVHSHNRSLAWKYIEYAHGEANGATLPASFSQKPDWWVGEVRENLEWVRDFLLKNMNALSVTDKLTMRKIWDWHLQYDKRDEFQKIAVECESTIKRDPQIKDFYDLLFPTEYYIKDNDSEVYAEKFSKMTATDLYDFLCQFASISEIERFRSSTSRIADFLGANYYSPELEKFVFKGLKSPEERVFEFSMLVAQGVIAKARAEKESDVPLLLNKFIGENLPERRQQFLCVLYRQPHPRVAGLISSEDAKWLGTNVEKYVEDIPTQILIISSIFDVAWDQFRSFVEDKWENISSEQRKTSAIQVIWQIHYRLLFAKKDFPTEFSLAKRQWLLNLVLTLDSVNELGSHILYELLDLIKPLKGSIEVSWVAERLQRGENPHLKTTLSERGHDFRIIDYVSEISSPYSDEDKNAIGILIDHVLTGGEWVYYIPKFIAKVDPSAQLVIEILKDRIMHFEKTGILDLTRIKRIASFAPPYRINSDSWRRIALIVTEKSHNLPEDEKGKIYSYLESGGVRSEVGSPESIVAAKKADFEKACKWLEKESSPQLVGFFKWNKRIKKEILDHYEENFKEDREDRE